MPWKASDAVRSTKKAGTSALRKLWADVANQTLERTGDEGRAKRAANSAIKKLAARRRR